MQENQDLMENSLFINEIIIASSDPETSRQITKLKREGKITKIASRVYTSNMNDAPEHIVRRNIFYILGKLYPKAVISHRSAFEVRPSTDGDIYLTYTYTRNVKLPGVTVHLMEGPKGLPSDSPFIEGLYVSSEPRAFLENMQEVRRRSGSSKCLPKEELENRLEKKIQTNGEDSVNKLRDEAKSLSIKLGMTKEYESLDKLIGAMLSTKPIKNLSSPLAVARALGEPYDAERVYLFTILYDALKSREFPSYPEPNMTELSYRCFAFFESYFSNYIEGTEFELDDARKIIETETPIPARNADSHDVLGTFYIVSNRKEMSVTPKSVDDLYNILQRRHSILMSARPEKNPGLFKTQNNRAGDTHFVDYRLVRGTLKKGFEIYQALTSPFAKAVFMLFMTSEVHPFADGNGRISRIMMNAELTAAGESKIIIPTVFRDDYLGALRKLTRKQDPSAIIKAMERVRLFSNNIRGENYEVVRAYLESSNAFKDEDGYILRF